MPGPWVAISAALVLTPAQAVPASPQGKVRQVYGDLVVEAKSATFTEDTVTFRDGVKATYLGEVLTADSLVLHPKDKKGEANGHVVLLDPAGTLSADDLLFSWLPTAKSGSATNVHLDLAGVMLEAEKAETIPGNPPTIVYTNVYGTSCARERVPLYAIRSPQMVFHPGKEGIIRHPTVYIYGKKIATLPNHYFSLDPRVHGTPMPGIALSKQKVGIIWAPSFFINKDTAASISFRSFKHELATGSAFLSRSFLPAEDMTNLIVPHSDLSERFGGSYFDNVRVLTPLVGANSLRSKRNTISVGSEINTGSINDPSKANYSKPLEAVYERGGPLGTNLGYQMQFRVQDIRRNEEPWHTRALGQFAIGNQPRHLAKNLFAEARLDAASYLGTTAFGWTREELGLISTPTNWMTLGISYAHGDEFGNAMYPADRLLIRNEGMGRLDFNLGPRKLSFLEKRDFDRHKWYREYSFSQTMGCLQAFIVSRQFPRSYQLGITLRLDEFFSILRSRKVQLTGAGTAATTAQTTTDHAVHP